MVVQLGIQTLFTFQKFLSTYTFLKESQWWNREKLEEYQLNQLKKLLNHSYENVPYYSKLFKKLNIKPNDINSLNDLHKIPYLEKEVIHNNLDDFKAINYPKYKFQNYTTGGSSGQPLQFFIEKGEWISKMMAYGKIENSWANRSFFEKSVNIIGSEKPYVYQKFGRTLLLSSFYMIEKYFPSFIEKINKLKPRYILSYPSAITNLALYMKRKNINFSHELKNILCFSETLYGWQRELLEEMFNCKVYEQYCQRESVSLGIFCEHSNYFHMVPEFGITELIGKDGKQVKEEDEIGEIVGTGFHNYIFPFIRYRTGDLGILTTNKCPCGRNYPLLKRIEGRTQEFIVSKTKQLVPLIGFHGLVAMSSQNVNESQIVQDKVGEIVLNIIKTKYYSENDSKTIKRNFQNRFGNGFNLTINFVDNIPRTKLGKFQFLIQNLPIESS
jgi:phenylacetate-CoA ligase